MWKNVSAANNTLIRGPCMNNDKMRNSAERDAFPLKWMAF